MKSIKFFVLATALALTACKAPSTSALTTTHASRDIYPAPEQAKADLAAALKTAASTHKRILLVFGGNWCADCKVLDIYFHDQANRPLLEANFVLVHVNIGRMDANLDIAQKYGVPLEKGVPALAVLSQDGSLLYSQKSGQFEDMRSMASSEVTKFLTQWEPEQPCSTAMVNC